VSKLPPYPVLLRGRRLSPPPGPAWGQGRRVAVREVTEPSAIEDHLTGPPKWCHFSGWVL
jgi:hypothetical protein